MWAEQLPRYDWDVGLFSCKKPTNPLISLIYFVENNKIQLVTQVGFQKWAESGSLVTRSFSEAGWTEIPEFPLYEVNVMGEIRNRRTMRILKGGVVEPAGYILVTLRRDGQNFSIYPHMLVCSIFTPRPHGNYRAIHKDGNRCNNKVDNLEWKHV